MKFELRNPFVRLKEQRAVDSSELSIKDPRAWGILLGGALTAAGIAVTEESAIRFSAVWACVKLKSQTLAQLPVELYAIGKGNTKTIDFTNPGYKVIKYQPNSVHTPYIFNQLTQAHTELWGNSYSIIERDRNGAPAEVWPLHPGKVTPVLSRDRKIYFEVMGDRTYNSDEILHFPGLGFDGIKGKSPIRIAAENIGTALGAQTYGASFFGNGANVGSAYEHPASLSDKAYERLQKSLGETHVGVANANKPMILEEGMKFARVGLPPEEAQFLETIKAKKADIATFFGVPQHLVGVMDGATFSNIEQQALEYIIFGMQGVIKMREDELNRKMLRTDEVGKKYWKYNVNALLRGDAAARAAFYKALFSVGAMSQNDIRELEDKNPVEGGDKYFVPLNMVDTVTYPEYMAAVIAGKIKLAPGANSDPNNTPN